MKEKSQKTSALQGSCIIFTWRLPYFRGACLGELRETSYPDSITGRDELYGATKTVKLVAPNRPMNENNFASKDWGNEQTEVSFTLYAQEEFKSNKLAEDPLSSLVKRLQHKGLFSGSTLKVQDEGFSAELPL